MDRVCEFEYNKALHLQNPIHISEKKLTAKKLTSESIYI